MMARFANPRHKQTWLRLQCLSVAIMAAVIATGDHAGAASGGRVSSVAIAMALRIGYAVLS
jgi:hypothetical protein